MSEGRTVKVKICGITCVEDAVAASEAGADAVGFVFANSPRQVRVEQVEQITRELDPFVLTVGVFVDAPLKYVSEVKKRLGLDVIQLHGCEDEDYIRSVPGRVIKAVTSECLASENTYCGTTLLVDQPGGGTGRVFDWRSVVPIASKRRLILAGGLNSDNVGSAVEMVRPYGVDVSSGVEIEPGRKDHDEIRKFIKRAKAS